MMKLVIIQLIQTYALQYGVDPQVAISVAAVESQFNPNVIGITGDVGVFQLNPKSFPQYTIKQLKDPKLNIQLGVKYLAKMKKECKYKYGLNWLTCYNMGPKKARTVKHPSLYKYVLKVKTQLAMNEKSL
jgi:soluble lytic murein transglycosylase-like protein